MTDNLTSSLIVAEETAEKIVNESLKYCKYSLLCAAGDKNFTFGKISHNFAEIIKSALNIHDN